MAKITKYGLRDLQKEFGTDSECLEVIFNTLHSKKCSCGGVYKRVKNRKQYQCSKCRFQIAPTAGTIFHKSDTPLTLWFYAIFLFSNAKSGLSAKQLERDLNVTYKTAWRMLYFIRKALPQNNDKLTGIVEVDTGYLGGVKKAGKDNKNLSASMRSKSVVVTAVERGGRMKAEVIPGASTYYVQEFLKKNIEAGAALMTDASPVYIAGDNTYNRQTVIHKRKEYVRGNAHVNTVEAFFAHLKRSIKGSHKAISKKYLPSYLDGFVFHYNNRHNDRERFASLLGTLLQIGKAV